MTHYNKKSNFGILGKVCLATIILLSLSACGSQSACPVQPDDQRYLTPQELAVANSLPDQSPSVPRQVDIGGKSRLVDKVVSGPLCNDHWKGTVYVTCDVQVLKWVEKPLFLEDCNLQIEPNTVVYVAYHNNAAYYNGCSCHTDDQPSSNP